GKYIKRRKALTAALGFLLLALIAGLVLTMWQLRASRIRERNDRQRFYAADMRQAAYDFADGNLVEMGDLLERHRPGSVLDDDWSGFEWNLLWKLLHRERAILQRRNWVYTYAYTPDGQKIFTSDRDGQIEMWDAATGQPLGNFASLSAGDTWILLTPDGKRLAIFGSRIGLRILDIVTKQTLFELHNPKFNQLGPIVFSPDGKTFAITFNHAGRSTAQLLDAATGQQVQMIGKIDDLIRKFCFSPDGRLLAVGGHNGKLRLWDIKAKRQFAAFDSEMKGSSVLSLAFTSDGKSLYAGGRDGRLHEFDIATRKPRRVWAAHSDLIDGLALTRDGKIIATSGNDTTVRLWNAATGREITIVKNEGPISDLHFSPDERSLAGVCMRQMRVKIWDVQELLLSPAVIQNDCRVRAIAFSKQSDKLAMGDLCGSIKLRELATGKQTDLRPEFACGVHSLDFSPDGKWLTDYSPTSDRTNACASVQVRDATSGEVVAATQGWASGSFSPDGKTLPMISDGKLKLWDWAVDRERLINIGPVPDARTTNFSPDSGRVAISMSDDRIVRVCDVAYSNTILNLTGHQSRVEDAHFSPDGKMIASASWDYTVKLWDARTGRELRTLKHGGSVYRVAFSGDGKRLASGGEDGVVRIWDTETGMELVTLKGHTKPIYAIAFSSDGRMLATGSWDGTVRLWRAATEQEVQKQVSR
ncbi:MAG: WD40 repeat domain-containing protein, partial [Acidobacteriota bacterium]